MAMIDDAASRLTACFFPRCQPTNRRLQASTATASLERAR